MKLQNSLIDNDVFFEHILCKYNIDVNNIDVMIEDDIYNQISETYNIDFLPYYITVEVLASKEQRKVFYLFLNNYMKSVCETSDDINSVKDISNLFECLCFIYLTQYYFL